MKSYIITKWDEDGRMWLVMHNGSATWSFEKREATDFINQELAIAIAAHFKAGIREITLEYA